MNNTDIINFLNSLCYSVQFDGIKLEEITLDSCRYDLEEMKKDCDPDDLEFMEQITPEMLHDEYIRIWKERNGGKTMYIIREVPPEECDFQFAFDDDGLSAASGDYNNTLFILYHDRWNTQGINSHEYRKILAVAEQVHDDFSCLEDGVQSFYGADHVTYKDIMIDNGIEYNAHKCHLLREWSKNVDNINPDDMAVFLSITKGEKWHLTSASGYSQGDHVDIIYHEGNYTKESARAYGEIYLGAAKEFCVIDLDENGKEKYSCYGYFVADSQAWKDEDYKKLVCEWAGIDPDITKLEMIDGQHTYTKYEYRTV